MTDFFKGSVIYPAQASKSNPSSALPKSAVISNFNGLTAEAAKFIGLYYDSSRSEEYLFWFDNTANIFEDPETTLSWTRNDTNLTRFAYNTRQQRWEPLKGSRPINLGPVVSGKQYQLNPTISEYLAGKPIYFDTFYVGDIPRTALEVQAIMPPDDEKTLQPDWDKVDIYINGETDPAKSGGNILAINPKYEGQTLWYNPSKFQSGSDGIVGHLQDNNIFISPIPAPTDTPLIRVGNRDYLNVILSNNPGPSWESQTNCYVNPLTGQLIIHPDLKAKHLTDKAYYNDPVYYDGIKMGVTGPIVTVQDAKLDNPLRDSFDTIAYKISPKNPIELKKDLNGKINVVNFATYIYLESEDSKTKITLRVDDDNKFESSKETPTHEEIEKLSKTDDYCFFNYLDGNFYVSENVAEIIDDKGVSKFTTVKIFQVAFTPLQKKVGDRTYSHDRKHLWDLTVPNSLAGNTSAGRYSVGDLSSLGHDRGYLYSTLSSTVALTGFSSYDDYKPYSELGLFFFGTESDSGVSYSLDRLTVAEIAGKNFWVNSTVTEGTEAAPLELTASYKPSPAQSLDFPPRQDQPLAFYYGPDKIKLEPYAHFIPDYSAGRVLWCDGYSVQDSAPTLRNFFTFGGPVYGPSTLPPFIDTSIPSSVFITQGTSKKYLFPADYQIPASVSANTSYQTIRYNLNAQRGVLAFTKNLAQRVCSGYNGKYDNTHFLDTYIIPLLELSSNYYLNVLSGTNKGVYKLNGDLTLDAATPFYKAAETDFSWEIYFAQESQVLAREYSQALNYANKDSRLSVTVTQSFTPADLTPVNLTFKAALETALETAVKRGRSVKLTTLNGPSFLLKIIKVIFAGFTGQPLPPPPADMDVFLGTTTSTFENLKNAAPNNPVYYITKNTPSDFYYAPHTETVHIPSGVTSGVITQTLDITNTEDMTFNAGLGLVQLKDKLLEGQTLNLYYYEADAGNAPSGNQQSFSSETNTLTAPTKFYRPSFKVTKDSSGLRNTVVLKGSLPEIKKDTLLILESSQVLRVAATDPSYDSSSDTTTITLSAFYPYEIGGRDLSKCLSLAYTDSLSNCLFKTATLSQLGKYGSRALYLDPNLSLYSIENAVVQVTPSQGPAAGQSYYHLVQSVADDGSLILKTPLALNFAAGTDIKLYYTAIHNGNITSALWLTPDGDDNFLDIGLSATPYSAILFDSAPVAGKVLTLNKDYSIAGKNILLNNGLTVSKGQTLVLLHSRDCGLLPGVPFDASLSKFNNLERAKGKPLRVVYSYSYPDSYQSQIEPLLTFAGNLEPKIESSGSSGTSGPLRTTGSASKPSGITHPIDANVLPRAQDRAAREKISYLNNVISNFEQITELLSGRFIGGVDGKFRAFTGKTLKFPIIENYEDPVSGTIKPIAFNTGDISSWGLGTLKDAVLKSILGVHNDIDNFIVTGKRRNGWWFPGSTLVYKPLYKPSNYSRLFPTLAPVFAKTITNGDAGYGYFDTNGSIIANLSNPVLGDLTNIRGISKLFDQKPYARIVSAVKNGNDIELKVSFSEDTGQALPADMIYSLIDINRFLSADGPPLFPSSNVINTYKNTARLFGDASTHDNYTYRKPFAVFYKAKNSSQFSYAKRHLFEDKGVAFDPELYLEIKDTTLLLDKEDPSKILGQKLTLGPKIYGKLNNNFTETGPEVTLDRLLTDYSCISYAMAIPFKEDGSELNFPVQVSSTPGMDQGLGRRYYIGSDVELDFADGSLIDNSILDVSPNNPGGHLDASIKEFDSDCPPPGVSLKGLARFANTRQTPALLPALKGQFLDDSGQDSNKFLAPLVNFQDYFNTYYDVLNKIKDIPDEVVLKSGITLVRSGYLSLTSIPSGITGDNSLLLIPTLHRTEDDSLRTFNKLTRFYIHDNNNIFFPAMSNSIQYFRLDNFITPDSDPAQDDAINVSRSSTGTGENKVWQVSLVFTSPNHKWGNPLTLTRLLPNTTNYLEIVIDTVSNKIIKLYKDRIVYSVGTSTPVERPLDSFSIDSNTPNKLVFKFGQLEGVTSNSDPMPSLVTATDYPAYAVSYDCSGGGSTAYLENNHVFKLPDDDLDLSKLKPYVSPTRSYTNLKIYNRINNIVSINSNYSSVILGGDILIYNNNLSGSVDAISFVKLTQWDNKTITVSGAAITTTLDTTNPDYYHEQLFYKGASGAICTYLPESSSAVSAIKFNQIPGSNAANATNAPLMRARRYSLLNNKITPALTTLLENCFDIVNLGNIEGNLIDPEKHPLLTRILDIANANILTDLDVLIGSYVLIDNQQVTVTKAVIGHNKQGQQRIQLELTGGKIIPANVTSTLYIKKTTAPIKQSLLELEGDLFSTIRAPLSPINTLEDSCLDINGGNIDPTEWDYVLVQTAYSHYHVSGNTHRNYNFYKIDKDKSTPTQLFLKSVAYTHNYSSSLTHLPGIDHTVILFKSSPAAPERLLNYYFFWRLKSELLSIKANISFDSNLDTAKTLDTSTGLTAYTSKYLNTNLLNWWGGFSEPSTPDSAADLKNLWSNGQESGFYTLDTAALGPDRKERYRWITYRTHRTKGSLIRS